MNIEVQLSESSTITPTEMRKVFTRIAEKDVNLFLTRPFSVQTLPLPNAHYHMAIQSVAIYGGKSPVRVHVYKLNYSKPLEDKIDDGDEVLSLSTQTVLPSKFFCNLWDSIISNDDSTYDMKNVLLNFMETALIFSDRDVCPDTVTCNRIILLYGPPGTGKTTICRGLAHKLTIRLSDRYSHGIMLEVNTHSLFSKWFAESGKMVKKLFDRIHQLSSDQNSVIFVLIDEVESIATARQSSMNGSDPSDAIRVVNALLTQIDQLRQVKNVLIMATSNLTECIDLAFISRADIKQYIGPPCLKARYIIFSECITELMQKSAIAPGSCIMDFDSINIFCYGSMDSNQLGDAFKDSISLYRAAEEAEGLSGRQIRRMPFLSFVYGGFSSQIPLSDFLKALHTVISKEQSESKRIIKV